MKTLGISIVLASVLLLAGVAHGAPTVAQERFEEGRVLMKEGKPREAIPSSWRASPPSRLPQRR